VEKNRLITFGVWFVSIQVALVSGFLSGVGAFLVSTAGASLLHRLIKGKGLYE
jgi:hypothetical protein